uniref:60S acidic ribosomal protein P2 n=1 Tax=Alexandrium catenella TaxID=2925 RepID=A0A7S1Q1S9_ALECA
MAQGTAIGVSPPTTFQCLPGSHPQAPAEMGLKYVAAYLMSALAGNESPTAADIQKILESVESDYDESIASKLVSELEGKTIHEVIASGKEKLKGFGGGGGGVAVAAGGGGAGGGEQKKEEKKEEKKVEEEEEEEEMDFDLFG